MTIYIRILLATRNRTLDSVAVFHLLIHFVPFPPIFFKMLIMILLKVLPANYSLIDQVKVVWEQTRGQEKTALWVSVYNRHPGMLLAARGEGLVSKRAGLD